jgi:Acetyltransferase (GNAT) domain
VRAWERDPIGSDAPPVRGIFGDAVALTVRALAEDELALWDDLVARSPQGTIFAQRWWIDIVTDGSATFLGCFDKDRLVAGTPVWTQSTLRVTRLRQPVLTPYWGPLVRRPDGSDVVPTRVEVNALTALADALLAWPDVTMQWHHSLRNWLPFYWAGFEQTTRYTYRIPALGDAETLRRSLHESVRRKLALAEREGLVASDMVDPNLVARLARSSMERQGASSSSSLPQTWARLADAAQARGCIFTNAVIDSDGNARAATAIVWDDKCAYNILVGSDARFMDRSSGTVSTWRAVEYASTVVPEFDFEGSMVRGVSVFYGTFGGELCPYLHVLRRSSTRLNVARRLRGMR